MKRKREFRMMYPYMTLSDDTEIAFSELLHDGTVKVCVEKPDEKWGLKTLVCFLPDLMVQENYKFSEQETSTYLSLLKRQSAIIMQLAEQGV